MDIREQIISYERDIRAVTKRYRQEFEIPVAAAVGVLVMEILDIYQTILDDLEDDDEQPDFVTP